MNRRFLGIVVAFAAAAALMGSTGNAEGYGLAVPYGFSTPSGSFAAVYWQNLVTTDPVDPSTLVFGDTIYIEFVNSQGNRSVELTTNQTADGLAPLWGNQSFFVSGRNVTVLQYQLPTSIPERNVQLCIDKGCMTFSHASPLTLIPSGVLTIGGLDLIAFGITVEFGLLAFPTLVAARSLARRALWFPKFKAWLVAPHVALGFVLLIGVDYRAFDYLFAGLGFLLIPVVFDLMLFLWSLHLFNVAVPVEATRMEPNAGRELTEYRWRFFVGTLPDGRWVLVGCYWRDAFARLCGHAPVLYDPKDSAARPDGPPAQVPIVNMRLDTKDEADDRYGKMLRRKMQGRPTGNPRALTQFRVTNVGGTRLNPRERDPPQIHLFVDTDKWLNATMPYLSLHRLVREAEVRDPTSGVVVKPARTVRKLAWPHYVESPRVDSQLAGIHYYMVPSVASLLWVACERAWRRLAVVRVQNVALRAAPFVLADESTEVSTNELFTLLERERFPISDAEAVEDTRSEAPKKQDDKPSESQDAVLSRDAKGQRNSADGGERP